MDENNPNQTLKGQATSSEQENKMLDDGSVVASSFVEGIDMDAINDAVDASKFTTVESSSSINVEDIDLDDTPTSDEELNRQLAQDPTMSLAHSTKSTSTNSVVEAINDSQESMSSIAANLDRSEKPKEEEEKKEDPSVHDAPTVSEAIIAPPRKRSPIVIVLILILLIAAAAIGIIYFKK